MCLVLGEDYYGLRDRRSTKVGKSDKLAEVQPGPVIDDVYSDGKHKVHTKCFNFGMFRVSCTDTLPVRICCLVVHSSSVNVWTFNIK